MRSFSFVFVTAVVVILLLIIWHIAPFGLSDAGNLVTGRTQFDAGHLICGTAVKHRFQFLNVSNTDCKATVLRTSCGCTSAILSSTTVVAGGELELALGWTAPQNDDLPEHGRVGEPGRLFQRGLLGQPRQRRGPGDG